MAKNNQDNLEYNDGLGDLLREKESKRFSIQRTIVVLLVFVAVVFAVLWGTVKIGTSFLFKHTEPESSSQTSDIDSDALVKELAEMERLMAQKKAGAAVSAVSHSVTADAQSVPTSPAKADVPSSAAVAQKTVPAGAQAPKPQSKPTQNTGVKPTKTATASQTPVKSDTKPPKPVAQPPSAKVVSHPQKAVASVSTPGVSPKNDSHSVAKASPKPVHVQPQSGFYYKVIVGTFAESSNAIALQKDLKKQGVDAFVWQREIDGKSWHAVQVAAFRDAKEAQNAADALRKKGHPAYVLHKP